MFGFNFGFTFAWALLLLPLVLFLPRASGTRTLRCLTLAVLIIALAQPEFKAPEESVALLIDVSDSVESRAKLTALDLDFSTYISLLRARRVYRIPLQTFRDF